MTNDEIRQKLSSPLRRDELIRLAELRGISTCGKSQDVIRLDLLLAMMYQDDLEILRTGK
jgi:hypothetical protein